MNPCQSYPGFHSDKLDLLQPGDDLNDCLIREVTLNYATQGKWYLPSVTKGYFIRDRAWVSLAGRAWQKKKPLMLHPSSIGITVSYVHK